MRRLALFFVLVMNGFWTQHAVAQSPSFDCSKARFPDEFAICRTPQLAELDNLIAAAYAYLKSTRGRPFADQIGIPFWRLRQACQSDTLCIEQRQIEALRLYQAAGAPVSWPPWVNSEMRLDPQGAIRSGEFPQTVTPKIVGSEETVSSQYNLSDELHLCRNSNEAAVRLPIAREYLINRIVFLHCPPPTTLGDLH